MATINDVAQSFVKGKAISSRGSSLNAHTIERGVVAVSYATPVAWRSEDGTVEVTTKKYSMSTARHVNAIKDAALLNGNKIVEVDR